MNFARATYRRLIAVALLPGIAGCTAEANRYIRFPSLASPGPAPIQRAEAIQHDPYPLNDVGPEVVGGRPLAYQQSLTEAERAKLVPTVPVVIQPSAPPGSAVMAPPVVSSPYAVAPTQPGAPLVRAPVSTMALPTTTRPITTTPLPPPPGTPTYSAPAPVVASPGIPVRAPAVGTFSSQRPAY